MEHVAGWYLGQHRTLFPHNSLQADGFTTKVCYTQSNLYVSFSIFLFVEYFNSIDTMIKNMKSCKYPTVGPGVRTKTTQCVVIVTNPSSEV